MLSERKIIVFIAMSADGFIARADGSVDWLDRPDPPGGYGMDEFLRSIDTIIWGRKTWEQGIGFGLGPYARMRNYVFSRDPATVPIPDGLDPGTVEVVDHQPAPFARELQAHEGKNVWMMGGGQIIASFLDVGALDEFIIFVIPVFIGEGIPLLAARHRAVPLELVSARSYDDGVVRLHYLVGGR